MAVIAQNMPHDYDYNRPYIECRLKHSLKCLEEGLARSTRYTLFELAPLPYQSMMPQYFNKCVCGSFDRSFQNAHEE